MEFKEQQLNIKTGIEYLEQAKDVLYSIIMDDTAEDEVDEFISDVISDIQEIIDTLDPEKDEDEG